jgi:diguanylate cyclase (GGDEF)-like protein
MPLRRPFRETGERLLMARRTTERPVSLLVIDIDYFKLVNDTFGHLQGDDVLRMVADQLRVNTRPTDYVARYAGDEFVAMLPGTRLEDAVVVAERIRVAVAGLACPRRDAEGQFVQVSLSIGAASAPMHGDELETLFASADAALYEAKRRGRNAVATASATGDGRKAQLLLDCFVGRTEERVRLGRLFDAAAREQPACVAVVGEAGVGKSTLLRQLAPDVVVRAGALLSGRCIEADVRPPYGPWVDVVAGAAAAGLVPARRWPQLGRLLPSLPGATGGSAQPTTEGSRFDLLQEIEELLTLASAQRPLVLILEDMHWADAASWDTLEYLLPRLERQRVLICLTIRGEDLTTTAVARRRRLSRDERFTELPLQRLSRDELAHWLRTIFGGQVPDAAIVEHLAAHTEGNPLFAIQTVRALVDEGRLQFTEGRWRYVADGGIPMPAAVEDLLSRRLDRLSLATREVLTVAAVIGREFDADTLLAAADREESAVLEAIDAALAASVLVPTAGRASSTLAFAHRLLAEVLLRTANPLRLRRTHARVARAIEARTPGTPGEVALHYDRAGDAEAAYRSAMQAGTQAAAIYAFDSAIDFLGMARRHAGTLAEHADVEWQVAQLHEHAGRYVEAERHCQLVLSSYSAGAATLGMLPAARRMHERLRLQRGVAAHEILDVCFELLEAARADENRAEIVALLTMVSQAYARLGDVTASEQVARQALAEAEQSDDARLQADATMRIGSTLLGANPADAVPHYRRALDLFTRSATGGGSSAATSTSASRATARATIRPPRCRTRPRSTSRARSGGRSRRSDLAEPRRAADEVRPLRAGARAVPRGTAPVRGHRQRAVPPVALYNLAHLAREEANPAGALELYGAACRWPRRSGSATCTSARSPAPGWRSSRWASRRAPPSRQPTRRRWPRAARMVVPGARAVRRADPQARRRARRARGAPRRRGARADARRRARSVRGGLAGGRVCERPAVGRRGLRGPLHRYAVHARALGYEPLVERLRAPRSRRASDRRDHEAGGARDERPPSSVRMVPGRRRSARPGLRGHQRTRGLPLRQMRPPSVGAQADRLHPRLTAARCAARTARWPARRAAPPRTRAGTARGDARARAPRSRCPTSASKRALA